MPMMMSACLRCKRRDENEEKNPSINIRHGSDE